MSTPKRRQFWLRSLILSAIALLLVAGAVVIGVRRYYQANLKPVSSTHELVEVNIPEGYLLPQISELLKDKKLIRNKQVFEQYVRNNGAAEDIKAGIYELSPSYSVQEIVAIITEGKIASNLITIAPGFRLDQIRRVFKNSGYSDREIDVALDPAEYLDHPALVDKPHQASLEGYLYPESFQRTSATTARDIVELSLDEMSKRLTPEIRAAFSAQGLSVFQAITLASVVEREVASQADRDQAAQVFLKRLQTGMKLQSDATSSYGAMIDGVLDQLSYQEVLAYQSAYNTYLNEGLPPGPISNMTEGALRAVAEPANTDWLYFVSGDDGITYFSRTIEEHEQLTKQHCGELCGN